MCAARNNRIDVIDFLLDTLEDLKIDAVDNEGQTALFHAALGGHSIVVQKLLDRGAHIDTKNKVISTALIYFKQFKEYVDKVQVSLLFLLAGLSIGSTCSM